MQRIVCHLCEFGVGLYGLEYVAGLERNYRVVKIKILKYLHMAHGTLHHGICAFSIQVHDLLFKGASVYAYPYLYVSFLCLLYYFPYLFMSAYVPWIYPQSIHSVFNGFKGQPVVKMDVSHERYVYLLYYAFYGFGRLKVRNRRPYYLAACVFKPLYLGNGCIYV